MNGMISIEDLGHAYDDSDSFDRLFKDIHSKKAHGGMRKNSDISNDNIPYDIFTDKITQEDIEDLIKESNNIKGGNTIDLTSFNQEKDRNLTYTSKENEEMINLINEIFHEDIRDNKKQNQPKPKSLVSKNPSIVNVNPNPNPLHDEDPREDLMYIEKNIQSTLFPSFRELISESPEGEDIEFYREYVATKAIHRGITDDDNDDTFNVDDQISSDNRSKSIDYFIVKMETDSDQMKKLFRSAYIDEPQHTIIPQDA